MLKNFIVGFLAVAPLVACGSSAEETGPDFQVPPPRQDEPAPGDGFGNAKAPPKPGSTAPDLVKCATSSAAAEPKPLSLVFLFDRSGSMTSHGSPKWALATAAAKAFFESPDSKGVNASLSFFPRLGPIANGVSLEPITCNAADYVTPEVALTSLPSTTFATMMSLHAPNKGDTPTQRALEGALTYAGQLAKAKGGSVAVVLVTDGLPDAPDCGIDPAVPAPEIAEVKQIAAAASATTPTYVIGVGDLLGNLNEIALGGGTKSAFIVSTADPTKVQADLLQAIGSIKRTALACDYAIPAAPAGQSFDRAKVNVQYTPEAGAVSALSYNATCAGGTGWRYDDATNPTRILACTTTCDGIKAKPGKVDIVFGCATRDGTSVQ